MAPPPPSPALMEELVEEILLRFPPDDPAYLVHAALVCKRWSGIVTDPRFRRRFCEFHRTPPMLGFFRTIPSYRARRPARFVPTTSFRPRDPGHHGDWCAIDTRYGRVLLVHTAGGKRSDELGDHSLRSFASWSGTPSRARRGSFRARRRRGCRARSPGPRQFSAPPPAAPATTLIAAVILLSWCLWPPFPGRRPSAPTRLKLLRGASRSPFGTTITPASMNPCPLRLRGTRSLYFEFSNGRRGGRALKYDLESHEASVIRLHPTKMQSDILITMEDGGLGCAAIHESKLYMWSRKDDHPLDNGWTPSRVIELAVLHPSDAILSSVVVTGYAGGVGVIFLTGYRGIYKVDLKNYKVKKVCEDSCYTVLPYMSFHTPVALGAASTGEGPRPHSLPQRSVEQRTTNHQESFATQP